MVQFTVVFRLFARLPYILRVWSEISFYSISLMIYVISVCFLSPFHSNIYFRSFSEANFLSSNGFALARILYFAFPKLPNHSYLAGLYGTPVLCKWFDILTSRKFPRSLPNKNIAWHCGVGLVSMVDRGKEGEGGGLAKGKQRWQTSPQLSHSVFLVSTRARG